jgi:hypothetical protein
VFRKKNERKNYSVRDKTIKMKNISSSITSKLNMRSPGNKVSGKLNNLVFFVKGNKSPQSTIKYIFFYITAPTYFSLS